MLRLPRVADENNFASIVEVARRGEMGVADIANLATWLADSGERLKASSGPTADLASTGGPGSLTTLVVPLQLRCANLTVVKLGVPGRPAGGIDVLSTIPGYRNRFASEDIRRVVQRSGYVHFLGHDKFAPADAQFFAYRKANKALAIPALVVASILSKKIAVGVDCVGLDIRVGPFGNFGFTLEEARLNASLFCQVAQHLGLNAVAFLYALDGPEVAGIGRGESLQQLAAATNDEMEPIPTLEAHIARCRLMAVEVAKLAGRTPGDMRKSSLREHLESHLHEQGTSMRSFEDRVSLVRNMSRMTLVADEAGSVFVDLAAVRDALVESQASVGTKTSRPEVFEDPAGVTLLATVGEAVQGATPLADLRHDTQTDLDLPKLLTKLRAGIGCRMSSCRTAWPSETEIVRA